ncbi:unnamed protein product [Malus baccata var. baccata]
MLYIFYHPFQLCYSVSERGGRKSKLLRAVERCNELVGIRNASNYYFKLSVSNMIPEMIKSSETMVKRWKTYEGKEIEVNEEFRFFTSEVISRTAFGSSFLEGKDIFEMLRELTSLIFRSTFKLRLPGISCSCVMITVLPINNNFNLSSNTLFPIIIRFYQVMGWLSTFKLIKWNN